MNLVKTKLTEKEIDDLAKVLVQFKKGFEERYEKKATFKLDDEKLKKIGLKLTNPGKETASFKNQIELRKHLKDIITEITEENRKDVFDWIVKTWGGVKRGDNTEYARIVKESSKEELLLNISKAGKRSKKVKKVASWSKILSFLYPDEYCIYDSRVTFTLDYLLGRYEFTIPLGRNTTIEKYISKPTEPTLDEYLEYCDLIKQLHPLVWPEKSVKEIYYTEMLIFSLLSDESFRTSIPSSLSWAVGK